MFISAQLSSQPPGPGSKAMLLAVEGMRGVCVSSLVVVNPSRDPGHVRVLLPEAGYWMATAPSRICFAKCLSPPGVGGGLEKVGDIWA